MPSDLSRLAPIEQHAVYPLCDFQKRVGMTRHGIRSARRNGLKVHYVHGRCFVRGADWIAYLERHGTRTKDGEAETLAN
jgi:hypothetical protein